MLSWLLLARRTCGWRSNLKWLLCAAVWLFSVPAFAADDAPIADGIKADSGSFAIALGIGQFQSPIALQENFTFYALPDIAWYGEKAYFENGLLGYSLQESENAQFDAVVYPGEDGLFFHLNGGTIGLGPSLHGLGEPVTVIDLQNRRIAAMAGFRYVQYAYGLHWAEQLGLDVSSVHDGWELAFSVSKPDLIKSGNFRLGAELGLSLKSASLVDYYYMPRFGEITPGEGQQYHDDQGNWHTVGPYEGRQAWRYSGQMQASYRLAQNWSLIGAYRLYAWSHNISDSPMVTRDHFSAWFGGVQYRF